MLSYIIIALILSIVLLCLLLPVIFLLFRAIYKTAHKIWRLIVCLWQVAGRWRPRRQPRHKPRGNKAYTRTAPRSAAKNRIPAPRKARRVQPAIQGGVFQECAWEWSEMRRLPVRMAPTDLLIGAGPHSTVYEIYLN